MSIVIITDSCSDLPLSFITENNICALSLTCHFKGMEIPDDFGKSLNYKEFYEEVRAGEMPSTSQINVYTFVEEFKKHIQEGKSIIYIGFSSALSGTFNSAAIARQQLIEEFPDADITVIDSKSASLGEGLIVYYAVDMMKKGKSKEEIVNWIEENKLNVNHWFTVDDLGHLKRGGRISGASAAIGTLLDIKPILQVDNEGRLIPAAKVKGRKKAISTLRDKLLESIVNPEEQVIAISHGDCIEEAETLKAAILEKCKVKDVLMNNIGPVIGSHAGPGTISLFFIGKKR